MWGRHRNPTTIGTSSNNWFITGDFIIYLDMEGFSGGSPGSACREAVRGFVNGWTWKLRSLGRKVGVYGSSCASYPTDWVTLPNVPDDVWLAGNFGSPSVRGLSCIADGYWSNHQRIHQYSSSHNEPWGGATINMDNDCADGLTSPDGRGLINSECL